jgi:transposase
MTEREAQLEALLADAQRENKMLRQKIDLLVRHLFGSKSEQINPAQMELLLGNIEKPAESQTQQVVELPAKPQPAPRQRRPKALRLPENLPVVEEIVDPEPVRANPQDWRLIGQEVSEQLDYEPGRFLRRRLVRRTYVHRKNTDLAPVCAPLPARLQERCIAGTGLMAQVVVCKFCDHIPLYRLEQIFKIRHGVHLPRQTLDRWIDLIAHWFKPIYHEIKITVLKGGYVQVDETPIDYLEPGFGRVKQGYYWVVKKPDGEVFFHWEPSRASAVLDTIIPDNFTGTIQCDGYSGYHAFATRRNATIQLAACWAHYPESIFIRSGFQFATQPCRACY